jgi:hypothetical protein
MSGLMDGCMEMDRITLSWHPRSQRVKTNPRVARRRASFLNQKTFLRGLPFAVFACPRQAGTGWAPLLFFILSL